MRHTKILIFFLSAAAAKFFQSVMILMTNQYLLSLDIIFPDDPLSQWTKWDHNRLQLFHLPLLGIILTAQISLEIWMVVIMENILTELLQATRCQRKLYRQALIFLTRWRKWVVRHCAWITKWMLSWGRRWVDKWFSEWDECFRLIIAGDLH